MKKTRKTMITSALLSAAVALQSESLISSGASEYAGVYGPPPAPQFMFGDMNDDSKTNIVDFILLKAQLNDNTFTGTQPDYSDINQDGMLTPDDIRTFQRYLFGKIPDIQNVYPDDRDDNPESVVTTPSQDPAVTTTFEENIMKPVYGPPSVMETLNSEKTEPIVSTIPEEPITQPVYGTYPVPETTEPIVFTTPKEQVIQSKYGPFPATEPVEDEEPTTWDTEIQCVYGPPSYFEALENQNSDNEVD